MNSNDVIEKKDTKVELNKSVYFILPMLGKCYKDLPNLINVYLGDSCNIPEYNFGYIFINNKIFEDKLLTPNFEKYYQLENGTYMFVYSIPNEYIKDYELFCDGKYSKFSDKYKHVLTNNKKLSDGIMYKILYRTNDRIKYIEDKIGMKLPKDAEVASVPDLDKEIYNYEITSDTL